MESHTKESDQQLEQKDCGETSSQIVSSIRESSTDTAVQANEQSQSEVQAAQDISNVDESEERVVCDVPLSSVSSVTEEVEQAEDKNLGYVKVKEHRKTAKKVEDLKGISIQDPSKIDRLSLFENIGVDSVSELESAFLEEGLPSTSTKTQSENASGREVGNIEIHEIPSDRASDTSTLSINTSASLSEISHQIAIPSTSRDSPGLEPEPSSPKIPNSGSHVKQSIFHPRNTTLILKKYPIPLRKGHNVYLRDSPESSDYGGSPDSLEDPFLMEALYSSENKETEDLHTSESSESTLCPQTHIDSEETEKPSESYLTEKRIDDQPSEAIEQSLDDQPSEAIEQSLDQPSEAIEQSLDDQPSEAIEQSLDDQPPEAIEQSLDDQPSEAIEQSLDDQLSEAIELSFDDKPSEC